MKKFYVRDADGEQYEVEEVEEDKNEVTEPALNADEIAALKKLAEVADRLIATVETAEEEPVADKKTEKKTEEPVADKKTEKKTEEVIETKTNDSMRSFGAIEPKKVVDEAIDNDVDDAWTKRYGG